MITINTIGFSNMFSYGQDVTFSPTARVTQLVGPNGVGKSGIPIILEELLFNKNSRGIKKADIENYETDKKGYNGFVDFTVGSNQYMLTKVVASATKLVLTENGKDISGHTTTQTYKIVESILGIDYQTFTKLVYQSIVSSLDFLTATDANRKKFLVSLLGLEKYVEAEKALKEEVKSAKNSVATASGSISTIKSWIEANKAVPDKLEFERVPGTPEALKDALLTKSSSSTTVELHNSIVKDNKFNISAADSLAEVEEVMDVSAELIEANIVISKAERDLLISKTSLIAAEAELKKTKDIKERCHACNSKLDVGNKQEMLDFSELKVTTIKKDVVSSVESLLVVQDIGDNLSSSQKEYISYEKYKKQYNLLNSRLDSSKPTEFLDIEELLRDITKLKTDVYSAELSIRVAEKHNAKVEASNSTREYQLTQLAKFKTDLDFATKELETHSILLARLEVLAASFGSKGLIAYKVESMVKSFEVLINEYLQVLSDGRFTLNFSVQDSKLSLNIKKGTRLVDIKSLSSGEFNKVNTATLLAVRKMMTAISKTDINLLFLDEVVSVLDKDSKDTLIEVLLRETDLNSIVVSHGYRHPLADVVTVVKINNISELEK